MILAHSIGTIGTSAYSSCFIQINDLLCDLLHLLHLLFLISLKKRYRICCISVIVIDCSSKRMNAFPFTMLFALLLYRLLYEPSSQFMYY